jgi:hypothetical protein
VARPSKHPGSIEKSSTTSPTSATSTDTCQTNTQEATPVTSTTKNTSTKTATKAEPTVEEALALVRQREDEHQAAEASEAALEARLDSGDDSVTATDIMVAATEIKRAATLLSAAQHIAGRAKRTAPFTPELAHILVDEIGKSLRVACEVVETFPNEVPATLPVAFIRQPKAHTRDTINGNIAGAVEVAFYRTELHVAASAERVEDSLGTGAVAVRVNDGGSRDLSNGVVADTLRMTVKSAWLDVPEISGEVQDWRISHLAQSLPHIAVAQDRFLATDAAGVITGKSGDATRRKGSLSASNTNPRVVSAVVTEGVRRIVIEASVSVTPTGSRHNEYSGDDIQRIVRTTIERLAGQPFAGVGRCADATVVSIIPGTKGLRSRTGTGRFTFVSQAV